MPPPWKMLNGSASEVNGNGAAAANDCSADSAINGSSHVTSFMKNLETKISHNNTAVKVDGGQIKVSFWPCDATEDELRNVFSTVGEITRARVLPPRDGREITLCFVTFSNTDEAEAAIRELNNHEVNGRRIRVENDSKEGSVKQREGQVSSNKSYSNQIKILSWPASLNEEDLKTLFSSAGEIERVRILPAREGRDITLAFVTFTSAQSSKTAANMLNGHEIEGKRLKVQVDDKGLSSSTMQYQEKREANSGTSRTSNANQIKILCCPTCATEDELKEVFTASGSIERVKILPAREGRDITLAFVTFGSNSEATSAAEKFDGYELMGKKLKVAVNDQSGATQQSCPQIQNESQSSGDMTTNVKPWGTKTLKPWNCKGSTLPVEDRIEKEQNDGGIFIKEGEMNQDFSLKPARAPVIYVPPPPPEEESEIFKDTSHQGINFQNYENIPVEVTGRDPPKKIVSFEEANLHPICMHNIKRANYAVPTPIQKHALPVILHGRDVMACAQTGSGKTAAYLLPIISNILANSLTQVAVGETAFPRALIIAPTRELAVQIFLEARKFAYGSHLRTVVIYGGVSVSHQLGKLYDGCDLLVATPGRLNDFLGRGRVSLAQIQYLVLDEADRMLDMGFGPTIKDIIESENMRPKFERQTLMLSATFPEGIQVLAANYLNDYIFVTVGLVGGASTDITQTIVEIPGSEKRSKLEEILLESGGDRILVFVETKRSADFLASFLSQRNFPTTSISSDRSQEERECALRDFRSGKAPVLIATAVAARGLDIADVKQVINYDLPSEVDEYVHRIGRTGRIGNQGRAIAFFDRLRDQKLARGLVKVLSQSNQVVPEWLEEVAMSAVGTTYGPGGGQFTSRDRRENNHIQKNELYRRSHNPTFGGEHVPQKDNANFTGSRMQPATTKSNGNVANDDDDMWC